ncbi:uncharacterized protein [Clytia hemisphaerica]|uniref:uncharacterized protein n=1 Tax=Clytia hemisphaerica TaxID=252671 RepID=UPI0034D4F1F3
MTNRMYLHGIKFDTITDHEPLVSLYNDQRRQAPARIENHRLKLQQYRMTVKYEKGSTNPTDYNSRHPLPITEQQKMQASEETFHINAIIDDDIPDAMTFDMVRKATNADDQLARLKFCILEKGYIPKNANDLQPFRHVFDELSVARQVVLRGERLIIPETAIPQQKHQPLITRKLPEGPWRHIASDFKGPIAKDYYFLLLIDEYSRFPEVAVLDSTTADKVVPHFDRILATHGIPEKVKTDNGPPFNSHDFTNYAKKRGFKHQPITPEQPWSNGLAENFMKVAHTAYVEYKDPKKAVHRYLVSQISRIGRLSIQPLESHQRRCCSIDKLQPLFQ